MAVDGAGLEQKSGGGQWQLMVRREIESYMGSMLGPVPALRGSWTS